MIENKVEETLYVKFLNKIRELMCCCDPSFHTLDEERDDHRDNNIECVVMGEEVSYYTIPSMRRRGESVEPDSEEDFQDSSEDGDLTSISNEPKAKLHGPLVVRDV